LSDLAYRTRPGGRQIAPLMTKEVDHVPDLYVAAASVPVSMHDPRAICHDVS
jgi:hypothetical protein